MAPGKVQGDAPSSKRNGAVSSLLQEIKSDYGMVVVDLPGPGALEPVASNDWLDEMVLVVEAERTRIQSAKRAIEMLERAGIRLRGVVLANRREHIPNWLYQRL
jgi:Mrp family chromosome partitioning ATPase